MIETEVRVMAGKKVVLYRDVETGLYRFGKDAVDMLLETFEECEKYRATGTVEEFKALKEKERKKKNKVLKSKVIFSKDSYAYCPHCHHCIELFQPSHCDKCGGELDWY